MTDIILRFMLEPSELLVKREYPPYFCNYPKCLPRVSGGGPDISFDEWMKLEFPRVSGDLVRNIGQSYFCEKQEVGHALVIAKERNTWPLYLRGQEKCSNAVADKAAIAKRFSFFRPRS